MTTTKALYHPVHDMRLNMYEVDQLKGFPTQFTAKIKEQARSVACILESHLLTKNKTGHKLSQQTLTLSDTGVAKTERFASELIPGLGTAFLVGKKVLLTAAHCVCLSDSDTLDKSRIASASIVFNFQMTAPNQCQDTFGPNDVYSIKKVIAHRYINTQGKQEDWALIKLDREVVNGIPLVLDLTTRIAALSKLYMLGHPSGLPLKLAYNAEVKSTPCHPDHFEANLDAFAGNSGSPVFSEDQQKVVGILVAGQTDYKPTSSGQKIELQTHHVTPLEIARSGYERCQRLNVIDFVKHYIEATEFKDAQACYALGLYYMHIAHQNPKKARSWLEKAVYGGVDLAQQPYNSLSDMKLVSYSSALHSNVSKGVNLEFVCDSPSCSSQGKKFAPLGVGTYNVAAKAANLKCSSCSAKIKKVSSLVFLNCRFTLEGLSDGRGDFIQSSDVRNAKLKTWGLENKELAYLEVTTQ